MDWSDTYASGIATSYSESAIVDGSFVTDKYEPGDIDLWWF